jgi:hypothetical protein
MIEGGKINNIGKLMFTNVEGKGLIGTTGHYQISAIPH